jgi:uncharacterized RDD family membrane protein YckC
MSPSRRGPLERLPQAIAEQVVRRIVEVIDVDEIVRRVDVDDVMKRIDVNAVRERVDVDDVVRRVDVDAVVARVDPNELMDRVDLDRLVARIDVNAIADRIDVDELVRRADLGPIIAQSTSGMLGEFLGLLRRQVVSLDDLLDRVTFFRRRTKGKPVAPAALVEAGPRIGRPNREGQYAGGITRLLAMGADIGAGWGLFLLGTLGVEAAISLLVGHTYNLLDDRIALLIATVLWGYLYFSFQWALSGRTIGMAVFGIRVVTVEGNAVSYKSAAVRTVVLPFSIALWPVGLTGIVVRSDRRSVHDLVAGTCVVYHWQARSASLPWLHRDEELPRRSGAGARPSPGTP